MAKTMKKIFSLILALSAVMSLMSVAASATGTKGEATVVTPIGIKTDSLIDRDTNRYQVNVSVPGIDGDTRHDEVILMVDGSYSGDDEWPAMKTAINTIGETVLNGSGNTQLTLMAFGMGDNIVLEHITSADALATALGNLPGTLLYGRSSTNCEVGFKGVENYIKNHDNTLGKVNVVYISDGEVNMDETARDFSDWQTIANGNYYGTPIKNAYCAFEWSIYGNIYANGVFSANYPAAMTTVFGDRFEGMSASQLLKYVFVDGGATDEEFLAYIDAVYADVYAYSGLTLGTAYPISVVERAFVKYDNDFGTFIQNAFYDVTYYSPAISYANKTERTIAAAEALAAMKQVSKLYVVDTNAYTAWMDTGLTNDKTEFVQSNGIGGLCTALAGALTELSKTPFNDVYVTDYMSKWVNLDAATLRIVDNHTGTVIWTAADGWLIEDGRPVSDEDPVIVELVDPSDYEAGGADVVGNKSGDIYKLTWHVKEGAMLRADSYTLQYEVTVDTEETGFQYGKDYPANGTTTLTYTDGDGNPGSNPIEVPEVDTPKPVRPVRPTVTPETPAYTSVTVSKVWEGDEESTRPESIEVQLYADGEAYGDAVTLNAESGWTYTWTELSLESEYTVDEVEVPEGYEKSVDGYTITNTYVEEVEEDVIEDEDSPLVDVPEVEESEEEIFEDEDTPLADVPETGDMSALWAAASVVSAAGMLFLGKKNKDEE